MAISFLDNVTLGDNQLQNVVIQVLGNDPAGVTGKLIYNSTANVLKYYNGSGWVSLTADTQGMTSWTVTADNGSSVTVGDGQTVDWAGGTGITTAYSTPSGNRTVTTSLDNTAVSAGSYTLANITVDAQGRITSAASGTAGGMTSFTLTGDSGTQDITDGNTVLVAGGTNITTAVTATDTVTVNLDASPTLAGELTVSGTGQSSFAGQVTVPSTPSASTDAASKAYVDSSVAGGLNVKGGFNASTGAIVSGGNLTSGGSRVAIAIGDYYVVTVAGNFFGNAATPLTPGDSVLVQTAAAAGASVEGDFAVIQSDTDLATASTVGIGNVNVNGPGPLDGLNLSYSAGTATVGVDIKNNVVASNALAEMAFLVYDGADTATNLALDIGLLATYVNSITSFAGTSSSGTSHTFNHNLNTLDVIVQVYDASNNETVYASVDRTSVNQVVVTTAASANIRCLIQKIV